MKKGIYTITLLMVFLLSSFVLAADVAYVVQDYNRVEFLPWTAMEELGLEVEVVTDSMIKDTDFSDFGMVLIGKGSLRNIKHIPEMPTVVMNGRYAKNFNLVERGRPKKIGASSILNVIVDEEVLEAYEAPSKKRGGPALAYYYLPEKFMNENLVSLADTNTDKKIKKGSVVAFGEGMCWFGITESDSWSHGSWLMFLECVRFVGDVEGHDVGIDDELANSVNGIRIRHVDSGDYVLEDGQLQCNEKYKIDYRTENFGDFNETVMFTGIIGDDHFNWSATRVDLEPGSTTTTGSKTITFDNETFGNGLFSLDIWAEIDYDRDIDDNHADRTIEVLGC